MSIHARIGLLLLLACLALASGCGGGSSPGTKSTVVPGSVQFVIVWPLPTRVIPAASQSLVIEVKSGAQQLAKKVIPRPPAGTNTSSVRFDALPPGIVTITVQAFPNPDGTGVVQAVGSTTVAIISGVTTQATIDPSSTVARLDLTPNPLVIIPQRPIPLLVEPRNSDEALVLVAPSSLQWSSEDTETATVDASGVVTGVQFGVTNVRVTDSESGQSSTATIHVVPPIQIQPSPVTLTINDQISFSATVTGLTSTQVTWSVVETQFGENIDGSGNFTAPGQPGIVHVKATSVEDPTISATATVTVVAGSGTVIIQ
jgi:hypothetical protein